MTPTRTTSTSEQPTPLAAARLAELIDHASVGIIEFDLEGRGLYANDHWRALTGIDAPVPIAGETMMQNLHPDDHATVLAEWNQAIATGEAYEATARVLHPSGEVRLVQTRTQPLTDGAGQVTGFVATLVDIGRSLREAQLEAGEHYRALHEQAPLGQAVLGLDLRVIEANRTLAEMVGLPLSSLLGSNALDFVHPDDLPDMMERFATLAEGTTTFIENEVRILRGDGETMWIGGGASLMRDSSGEPCLIQALLYDVTARRDALEALAASEARYRTLVETAPIGQVVCDLDGSLLQANQAYADLVGAPVDRLIGRPLLDRLHTDDLRTLGDESVRLFSGEIDSFDIEYRIVRVDGSIVWVRGPISLMYDEGGAPTRVTALVQDIHERREAEQRERQLSRIIESTSDLVGTIDPGTGRLLYLNRAARDTFGLTDRDITELDALSVYSEASARFWETDVAVTVEMGRTWIGELDMLNKDGEIIHVQQSISPDLDERGHARQVSFVGRDVTQQRRREVELAHRATHDPLTGLPNRSLLLQLAEHALHQGERNNSLVALLFMDLDRFKTVNDTLGHNVGDALLIEVAQRITSALRPSDTVARLGGDEFVVLCEDISDEHRAVAVAQRITAAIEQRPFTLAGASLSVTTSVGIALSGNSEAHPESLLRDADAAMYRAKDRGRARHEIFDDEMRRRTTQRLELADELALAIERGHIVVYYQPIIDLVTGQVDGVEALCRWDHPTRGILGPGEFIGLAEETGLIVGLGLSVLSRACDQARRWEVELGNRAPKVHVNLSARQLTSANLPRLVQGVIDQALIEPSRLCLEVTESVIMDDAATSIDVLRELKDIGVELAIDDFGTGYSSLAYLRRFPVDVLKIDRSFVDGIGPDADDSAIVSVIVSLARSLGLTCVAEGVETAEQLAGLRALGCEQAQGFYFARPHPVPEVNRYLTTTFDLGAIDLR